MEFSRNNLSDAVYYILTLNPNKKFSLAEMINKLDSENACPEFSNQSLYMTRSSRIKINEELDRAMTDATLKYNNVHYSDGLCYLKQRNKHVEFIEPSIKTEVEKSSINIESLEYDGDSLLHLLCRNSETELLETISKYYEINVNKSNSKGESLLDVVSDDDTKTLKTLIKILLKQHELSNVTTKEYARFNASLNDENTTLLSKLIKLSDKHETLMTKLVDTQELLAKYEKKMEFYNTRLFEIKLSTGLICLVVVCVLNYFFPNVKYVESLCNVIGYILKSIANMYSR